MMVSEGLSATEKELLDLLLGAQKALRKALPFLPPDDEAHFCGEWLDDINEGIKRAQSRQLST